eukprot:335377_1
MKCRSILDNPYLRIIIKGVLSFFIISGIYSCLGNVNEIKLTPDQQPNFNNDNRLIQRGIMCVATDDDKSSQMQCNAMTKEIINITITNSSITQWKCGLYTDYSNKKLYDISPFKEFITCFFLFAAISTIFVIIHDLTLIFYRNNLDRLISGPRSSDIHCSEKIIAAPYKVIESFQVKIENKSEGIQIFLWFLLWLVAALPCLIFLLVGVIFFFLELFIWTMIIYPFYLLICKKLNCNGFSYVSSMWLGMSSALMTMFAMSFLMFMVGGFDVSVPSLNAHKCDCSCNYILPASSFYSFVLADIILAVANVKFLFSWCKESVHGQQFMNLINDSLPLFQETYQNNKNPTVSIINGKHLINI